MGVALGTGLRVTDTTIAKVGGTISSHMNNLIEMP